MFAGLVEALGVLIRRTERGRDARLVLRGAFRALRSDPIVLGESISVDGVCLTVDTIVENEGDDVVFEVDASSETLARTTLGTLAIGGAVNLERALPASGRLGGHHLSGHRDGGRRVGATPARRAALGVVVLEPPGPPRLVA